MRVTSLIVGARFRPPAAGLLSVLGSGSGLLVRLEPSNPYDPNALQVLVATSTLAKLPISQLQSACEGFGVGAEELCGANAPSEWHLGYVPRGEALEYAPGFDAAGVSEIPGEFTFDLQGRPSVSFEVPA